MNKVLAISIGRRVVIAWLLCALTWGHKAVCAEKALTTQDVEKIAEKVVKEKTAAASKAKPKTGQRKPRTGKKKKAKPATKKAETKTAATTKDEVKAAATSIKDVPPVKSEKIEKIEKVEKKKVPAKKPAKAAAKKGAKKKIASDVAKKINAVSDRTTREALMALYRRTVSLEKQLITVRKVSISTLKRQLGNKAPMAKKSASAKKAQKKPVKKAAKK